MEVDPKDYLKDCALYKQLVPFEDAIFFTFRMKIDTELFKAVTFEQVSKLMIECLKEKLVKGFDPL